MFHFIGDFDNAKRRDAIDNMKSLLSVIAEVGSKGAITPASYRMHSNRLPPFKAPRTPEDDGIVLLEGLQELGEHAAKHKVQVFLEPLNSYEDHILSTLEQGVALIKKVGLKSVTLMADLYHMNIEEKIQYRRWLMQKTISPTFTWRIANGSSQGKGKQISQRLKKHSSTYTMMGL
jgi:sugar phosphate isomerase/epimerase